MKRPKPEDWITAEKAVGRKFGKLMVLEALPRNKGQAEVRCLCQCGRICTKRLGNLVQGVTRSCGCSGAVPNMGRRAGRPRREETMRMVMSEKHIQAALNAQYLHYREGF